MHDGEYTLLFDSQQQMEQVKDTTLNDAIVEKIFLDNDFIRQYIFSRRQGKWMLCEVRNQTLPRNPNASFIDFYHHFVTDSAFQELNIDIALFSAGGETSRLMLALKNTLAKADTIPTMVFVFIFI